MEAKYYNSLAIAFESNFAKLAELKRRFGSWGAVWQKERVARVNPEKEWEKLQKAEVRLILAEDADFPDLLRETPSAPLAIYVRGVLPPADRPALAIVGTRKATPIGLAFAQKCGRELAERGIIVVSGLALGIDQAAHKGALEGDSITLAVLANGLDNVYPKHHKKLADDIIEKGGALISEYPIGTPSLPHQFIGRNRIISGLSRGVIVVEAPIKSGALATALFANDQNREVLAVPGPANHPNYAGCNQLIRRGAILITSTEEALAEFDFGQELLNADNKTPQLNDENEKVIFAALQEAGVPLSIDKIAESTTMDISAITRALTFLVLRGVVKEAGGKYFI